MLDYTIGIIGGNGRMGSFFKKMFLSDNIEVLISDVDTRITNRELAERADIIIICVPIDVTVRVISEINPVLTKDKLLLDITSIKVEPVNKMLESQADVIGMHPMFGPTIPTTVNQTLILTPGRDTHGWINILQEYFKKKGMKVKITTTEQHDKIMSLIQVLIHFNSIAIGITMSRLGFDIKETLEYTSPIYRMELLMISRIFAQSPRLYGNIPMRNPHTLKILLEHKMTIEHLSKIILTKDMEKFTDLFENTANYFNNFKKQSIEESNFLISKLVEYHLLQQNLNYNLIHIKKQE